MAGPRPSGRVACVALVVAVSRIPASHTKTGAGTSCPLFLVGPIETAVLLEDLKGNGAHPHQKKVSNLTLFRVPKRRQARLGASGSLSAGPLTKSRPEGTYLNLRQVQTGGLEQFQITKASSILNMGVPFPKLDFPSKPTTRGVTSKRQTHNMW